MMKAMFMLMLWPSVVIAGNVVECEVLAVNKDVIAVCGYTTLYIPLSEWPAMDGWGRKQPVAGLRIKAIREAVEGRLRAIPDCETRLHAAMEAYCGGMYCKPPINSLMPEDCR